MRFYYSQADGGAGQAVLLSRIFVDCVLTPHLAAGTKRKLRLVCKALQTAVDGSVSRVTVGRNAAPSPLLARLASSINTLHVRGTTDQDWLQILNTMELPKLASLSLDNQEV